MGVDGTGTNPFNCGLRGNDDTIHEKLVTDPNMSKRVFVGPPHKADLVANTGTGEFLSFDASSTFQVLGKATGFVDIYGELVTPNKAVLEYEGPNLFKTDNEERRVKSSL